MRVCLAGNPNSGKTTIFNALTGSRQRVGNWAGVTVDKKVGEINQDDVTITITDLPGTYSLSVVAESGSIDERIACEHILGESADVVVNIIDAANLERNLYLTAQLLEMQVPVVLAVNMIDIAKQHGFQLDLDKLSELTGCPVVGIVGRKRQGIDALKHCLFDLAKKPALPKPKAPQYAPVIAQAINGLIPTIKQAQDINGTLKGVAKNSDPHWLASRLLEQDIYAKQLCGDNGLCPLVDTVRHDLEKAAGEDAELLLADARYTWAGKLVSTCRTQHRVIRQTVTDWFDCIALNRVLGLPIFLLVMYAMFEFSINIGGAFQPIFDDTSRTVFIDGMMYLGHIMHLPIWLTAIVAQGVGLGINTVITFIPQIGGMFLFLAFLEDSGYMARAAFVMDRFMQWVGLPGKSFVPLIVGFGCNVPAIMATRTLESRRDRLLTIMMSPFMSCGARLAIFAVFASAFFPKGGATVVFLLYMTGIAVAILTGLVVKKTLLQGEPAPFIMEMPPYHMPAWRTIFLSAWQRLKRFLFRAGKVIVPICVLVGTLNTIQVNGTINPSGSRDSMLSVVGKAITPALAPMGVKQDNWPATVGLVTGFLAKEVVVGTMNTLYTQNNPNNRFDPNKYHFWGGIKQAALNTYHSITGLSAESFANPFTANEAEHNMTKTSMGNMVSSFGGTLSAFAYLLFILLYVPCVSTIAVTVREASKAWAWLSTVWSMVIAYTMAVCVYQVGTFMAHPMSSLGWITGMLLLIAVTIFGMHRMADKLTFVPKQLNNGKTGGCH